jgi:hypothetical protein
VVTAVIARSEERATWQSVAMARQLHESLSSSLAFTALPRLLTADLLWFVRRVVPAGLLQVDMYCFSG